MFLSRSVHRFWWQVQVRGRRAVEENRNTVFQSQLISTPRDFRNPGPNSLAYHAGIILI